MKYVIALLVASALTGCAEFHPERVDWDGVQRAGQQQQNSNNPQQCQYWKDVAGNVYSKCQ